MCVDIVVAKSVSKTVSVRGNGKHTDSVYKGSTIETCLWTRLCNTTRSGSSGDPCVPVKPGTA